jgi:hypothetical protein
MAFTDNVERSGRLNEAALIPEIIGYGNIKGLAEVGPQGARMALKGKMPLPVFHKKVDNYQEVKRIYDAMSNRREDES